jgi:predicted phosphoadenosine phosphosulfate sulfurtransferase
MSDLLFAGRARPHYFLPGNVWDAALKRVRWVFEEFGGHVSVSSSGGKDSTIVLELALIVARERGELPLRVQFLDQEAEYEATIEYMRRLRDRPEIDLEWYQIPFRLFNASNHADNWSHVWDEDLAEADYIRPREPGSIRVNDFLNHKGQVIDRFKDLLSAMNKRAGGAHLTGMRCEESPNRRVFMTSHASYKWATWASGGNVVKGQERRGYYLLHPVYDWSYRDVWHAIESNGWDYNRFYDLMFRHGVSTRAMRVSSFHHEESMGSLDYLQELEPETWAAATRRYAGISTFGHVGEDQFAQRMKLPYMFNSWMEYFDFLVEKLIPDPEDRRRFCQQRDSAMRQLSSFMDEQDIMPAITGSVIGNDVYGATTEKWIAAQKNPDTMAWWGRVKAERDARAFG